MKGLARQERGRNRAKRHSQGQKPVRMRGGKRERTGGRKIRLYLSSPCREKVHDTERGKEA